MTLVNEETALDGLSKPFPEKGGLVLSFNKANVEKLKAKPTKLNTHLREPEVEKQYITSLNEEKLERLAAGPTKKAVVVPLLKKNVWKPDHLKTLTEGETPETKSNATSETSSIKPEETKTEDCVKMEGVVKTESREKTLDEEAMEALVEEGRNAKNPVKKEIQAIPLLVENAVPGHEQFADEESKFKHDISLRPDDVGFDAYDRVSIDDFGTGMLLGMGWRPGQGFNGKEAVEPIEFIPRAGRLGLGANPADKLSTGKKPRHLKPGETEPELMRLAPGPDGKVRHYRKLSERLIPVHSSKVRESSLIEVTEGPLYRLYGRVRKVGTDEECEVVMNLTEQVVSLKRSQFTVLDEHALPKDHPAFTNKFDVEKKKKEEEKQQKQKQEKQEKRDRKDERYERQEEEASSSSHLSKKSKSEDRITWLVPGLVVRVASKSLLGGKYYNKKGTVEDVVSLTQFTLTMEDGRLVEDAKERHVQTALPKAGGRVRIVLGPNKGQTGDLLERNAAKERATVHLDSSLTVVQEPFDNVCEYNR